MSFKKCVNCKKSLPEHLIEDYRHIAKSPICPICARTIINKMRGNPPGTDFINLFSQEDHLEARKFLDSQCVMNRGGYIINPPEGCIHSIVDGDTGTHWVDASRCNISCDDSCSRFWQFKRMTKQERKDELLDNGVRLF